MAGAGIRFPMSAKVPVPDVVAELVVLLVLLGDEDCVVDGDRVVLALLSWVSLFPRDS
jgi:hypothetical protein